METTAESIRLQVVSFQMPSALMRQHHVLPAHADAPAQSRQQIEKVVEKFRLAIVNKDKDNFMRLFLREDITWSAAYEDASLDRIMARRTNIK